MKNRKIKRLIAGILTPFLLVQIAFATELGETMHQSDIDIGIDTNLTAHSFWHTASNVREQEYYIDASPSETAMPAVVYGNKLYGKSTIDDINSYLQKNNINAVAGINADYFSLDTGLPLGMVVTDGILRCSDAGFLAVGFDGAGKAFIGKPNLKMTADILDEAGNTAGAVGVDHLNKLRTPYALYMYTSDFSSSTQTKTEGIDVILRIQSGSLKIGGEITAIVESVSQYKGALAIADDMIIISCDLKGPLDKISPFAAGQTVKIRVSSEDDRFNSAQHAVSGYEKLVTDGAVESGLAAGAAPRTCFGVKADGGFIMYVVDGRQSSSYGLSLKSCAQRMVELGAVEAINFDGGGSTVLSAEYPGSGKLQVLNSPSDGALRKCANYIMLVNKTAPTTNVEKLFLFPYDNLVLGGGAVNFSIRATDKNYNAVPFSGTPEYLTDENLGTVTQDGVFTAGNESATGRVFVKSGEASGSATVKVVGKADELVLKNEKTGKVIYTLSPKLGESLNLSATAYYNTYALKTVDTQFNWSVTGDIGAITADGAFTATTVPGASGVIKAEHNGVSVEIPVTVGKKPGLIEDFEQSNYATGKQSDTLKITEERDIEKVRFGRVSGKLAYNLTAAGTPNNFGTADIYKTVSGEPQKLYAYVFGNGSGAEIGANVYGDSGEKYIKLGTLNFTGWKRLEAALPAGTTSVLQIAITNTAPAAASGTVYIDQIIAAADGFNDVKPPEITITNSASVLGAEGITFTAKVSDESMLAFDKTDVALYRDGVPADFSFDSEKGEITANIKNFEDNNLHKITVTAVDLSGNIGSRSVDYNLGKTTVFAFADTAGHFSKEYANFLFAKGIVSGELVGENRYFYPNNYMTRQEFAKIMTGYLGLKVDDYAAVSLPFADASSIDSWALPYVKAIYASGVIKGKDGGNGKLVFDPKGSVTRAELITIIGRTSPKGYPEAQMSFGDLSSVPEYAKGFLGSLVWRNVVSGYEDGTFKPNRSVTRGEMAKIFYNVF